MTASSLNRQDIVHQITDEIKAQVSPSAELTAQTDMTADIQLDSVAVMNLIFALEEAYDLSIPLNSLAEIRTIGELADYVIALKSEVAHD